MQNGQAYCFDPTTFALGTTGGPNGVGQISYPDLNLFAHEKQKNGDIIISEVSDHYDWKVVRNNLIKNTQKCPA